MGTSVEPAMGGGGGGSAPRADRSITTQELLRLCETPAFAAWRRGAQQRENEARWVALRDYSARRRNVAFVCAALVIYESLFFTWGAVSGVEAMFSASLLGAFLALRFLAFLFLALGGSQENAEQITTVVSTASFVAACCLLDTSRPIGYAPHVAVFALVLKFILLRGNAMAERARTNTFGKSLLSFYPSRQQDKARRY